MVENGAIPATTPLETPPPEKEEPLVTLKYQHRMFAYIILFTISFTWFSIFGCIIPYLATGDFDQIWPAHSGHIPRKQLAFVFSWFWLIFSPIFFACFRIGVVSFYETHVELRPYLTFIKKATIPFNVLHAYETERGMTLTNGSIPKWRENQFKHWKTKYWASIIFTKNSTDLCNPEGLPQALQIIHEKAVKIDRS